ncbi:MAG: hypothetical protein ACI4KD_04245 [Oscillospiraceae bacterium]
MSSAIEYENPLLKIDTSFQSYLILHSLTPKITSESVNYAFQTECLSRQSLNSITGWNKLVKSITSTDMPSVMKRYFDGAVTVDGWNNTKIYDIAKTCAERLKARLPAIMINTKIQTPELVAVFAEGIEPCIIMTKSLVGMCSEEELVFVLATGISRTHNNHCIYNFIAPYIGFADGNERQKNFTRIESIPKQLNYIMTDWARFADVTNDRAVMICLDEPERFPFILKSLSDKKIPLFMNYDNDEKFKPESVIDSYNKTVKFTAARDLNIPPETTRAERRILCALEFLNCEIYYNCRSDISSEGRGHIVNKPMIDLRCDIIIGASKGVE